MGMAKTRVVESLEGHLLVAMPSMIETLFQYAVLYIYEHDASGAMGFIINKPLPISMADILRQLCSNDITLKTHEQFLLRGGPVCQDQLYIIKQDHEDPNRIALVQPQEVMDDFAKGKLLDTTLPILGYSGWSSGQLEHEIIKGNEWLICPAYPEILFDIPMEKRWAACLLSLGINPDLLVGCAGHA